MTRSKVESRSHDSDKDGKPDSWSLFDLYKLKRNPVTKFQEPVPEILHISHQNLQNIAQKHLKIFISVTFCQYTMK